MESSLTREQKVRYSRQVAVPEIGVKGQIRLRRGRVLIVGLGGLGSIISYYLTAAGVGCLRVVDRDTVAVDNLNRQILHSTPDLGRPKTASAAEKLRLLNPACRIEPEPALLEEKNGYDLAEGCDLIVDGTDNLATRHVLNRISLARRIPFIYGGINGWNGTAGTFVPGRTCCLACLFPPNNFEIASTAGTPALGPAAGVIGSIQAMEAIRILLGVAPVLSNRLMHFQGKDLRFRFVQVESNPDCAQCGPSGGV